jgi:hypothetical protein
MAQPDHLSSSINTLLKSTSTPASVGAALPSTLRLKPFKLPTGISESAFQFHFKYGQLNIVAKHAMLPFGSWPSHQQGRARGIALDANRFSASHKEPRELHKMSYRCMVRPRLGGNGLPSAPSPVRFNEKQLFLQLSDHKSCIRLSLAPADNRSERQAVGARVGRS